MPPTLQARWQPVADITGDLTVLPHQAKSQQQRSPQSELAFLQARSASPFSSSELSETLHQYTGSIARRALRTNVIPLSYNLSGAAPGIVVGAVLGAIAGFLLLFWLIWFATLGRPSGLIEGDEITDVHISRRSDRSETRRSRRSRRTRAVRSEVTEETRRSPTPQRRERVVVEETRRRTERSQPPPPPPPMSDVSRERETIYERETERRVEGDDMVEVMEEDSSVSEVPRSKRKSGYRTVDPNAYAGGNYPRHEVDRENRRSSRR